MTAETHVAVADIVTDEVYNGLDGVIANFVAAHFKCLLANLDGLLELVADEVLVVVTDIAPFLLAREHEACAKVAIYRHVEFLADDNRVFNLPF